MIHTPSFTEEWLTVTRLVKSGDILEIRWNADGWANQYAQDATTKEMEPVHVDHMTLSIWRKDKRYLTFVLGPSICPDNTARMIQY